MVVATQVLEGRSAIVTGAASGMGQAVGEAFAKAGARVVFADINADGAEAAAKRARLAGAEAFGIVLDVADPESVQGCVNCAVDRFGAVDLLFNVAGLHHMKALLDITPESFDRLWRVNVLGLFLMLQVCARQMIAQGSGGRIINVASIAGREGRASQLEYNATKAAVINMTRSAALELSEHRIGVNAIAPGAIITGMWQQIRREVGEQVMHLDAASFDHQIESTVPVKRLGVPADIVGAALLLASSAGEYIIGQTINVDGGLVMN